MKTIIIGTRGSNLALAQAREVQRRLQVSNPDILVELKIIKTKGDKRLDLSLNASGDKGLFTKELEIALLEKEIDCAVHSLKDLPVLQPEGTYISCVLPRANPHDALLGVASSIDSLPKSAIVGTSSPRRAAQILEKRPDILIKEIRGNVETRLSKLDSGEYDALVMACAGLERLGLQSQIASELSIEDMVPAPGQGAIAIQQRVEDKALADILSQIHCPITARCTEIERYILQALGGGCAVPLGCFCEPIETSDETDDKIYQGYLVTLYNLNDDQQTLKAVVVGSEASNDEIYKYLQEKTIPLRRE